MMKRIVSIAVVLICLSATAGHSAPLTTGADFLLTSTGARPDAMGHAFSAVADDINTLTFNPAGLGNIREPEIGYGHESFVSDINYDFIGGAFPLGGLGVLGLGYVNMGTGLFNSTANVSASSTSVDDQAFILGWGKSFYNLHVGLAVKYINEQIDTVQGSGFAFDMGLRYRLFPNLTIAASLLNVGDGVQLVTVEPLPTIIDTGAAWTIFENPANSLTVASDAICNITTNTQNFGFGAEYWFHKAFALRGGYLLNSVDTTDGGFSAGAGVQLSFLQLDYAFEPFSTQGVVNRISGIIRWDGPWVPGGEPNPPEFVTCVEKAKTLEIRWAKARGPVTGYEVLVQPLNGGEMIVSAPVTDLVYEFKKYEPDTLYKISVRSVGEGDGRSFPAKETYVDTGKEEVAPEPAYGDKGEGVSKLSVANGVNGVLDVLGLKLSWEGPADNVEGYNLYRKTTEGAIKKINLGPKHGHHVWISDVGPLQGSEWFVTAILSNGKEKRIGSYLWYPTLTDLQVFNSATRIKLGAEAEPGHKVYLDWDNDPLAVSYDLFLDRDGDGIYELYQTVDKPSAGVGSAELIKMSGAEQKFSFIIVSKDDKKDWLKRSNEASVELIENSSR